MASEGQIAANRRNARKSTGPRSPSGKQRASRNAYRHGLSAGGTGGAAFLKQRNELARQIVGDTDNEIILECARAVAEAGLDLAQMRRAKVAIIERGRALGNFSAPEVLGSVAHTGTSTRSMGQKPSGAPTPTDRDLVEAATEYIYKWLLQFTARADA